MDADLLLLESPTASADQLPGLIGWSLKPEGLCRDDVCIPVQDRAALGDESAIDLVAVAGLLDRPAVADESGLTAIGALRARRRSALVDLVAPDFSLPNLEGGLTALSDHGSKKRLLVAFSSW
jgi:hypothetical protein